MTKRMKLLGLFVVSSALLLSACEIPGGSPPAPPNIVFADPGGGVTSFSGFPAIFKGTNVVPPHSEVAAQAILAPTDEFFAEFEDTTVWIQVHCDVGNPDLWVYIDSDAGTAINAPCGPGEVILAPAPVANWAYVEIHSNENPEPGVYPYVVHVTVVEPVAQT